MRKETFIHIILPIVLTVVTILTTIIIYVREGQTKSLQSTIISNTSLVSVKDEFRDKIQIVYEGKRIRDLSLIQIALKNTRNVPIRRQDYDEPIRLSVSDQAQIVNAEIVEVSPKNVRMSVTTTLPYQVALSKSLLNPGDQAALKLVCINNDKGIINIDGRIVGTSQIELVPLTPGRLFPVLSIVLILLAFVVTILSSGLLHTIREAGPPMSMEAAIWRRVIGWHIWLVTLLAITLLLFLADWIMYRRS